ncbi:MAG: hypothetical protein V7K67_32635 [Nostoc sp.]
MERNKNIYFDSAAKPLSSPLALASPNVIRGDAKSDSAALASYRASRASWKVPREIIVFIKFPQFIYGDYLFTFYFLICGYCNYGGGAFLLPICHNS